MTKAYSPYLNRPLRSLEQAKKECQLRATAIAGERSEPAKVRPLRGRIIYKRAFLPTIVRSIKEPSNA